MEISTWVSIYFLILPPSPLSSPNSHQRGTFIRLCFLAVVFLFNSSLVPSNGGSRNSFAYSSSPLFFFAPHFPVFRGPIPSRNLHTVSPLCLSYLSPSFRTAHSFSCNNCFIFVIFFSQGFHIPSTRHFGGRGEGGRGPIYVCPCRERV